MGKWGKYAYDTARSCVGLFQDASTFKALASGSQGHPYKTLELVTPVSATQDM